MRHSMNIFYSLHFSDSAYYRHFSSDLDGNVQPTRARHVTGIGHGEWRPHTLAKGLGCAPAIWRLATDTVEVDLRHFNRVLENDIKNGQLQFGIVHIYDIFILAQACTASQIGRRLSASLFK